MSDKRFIVYRAISKTNGKSYVGMTGTSLRQRISSHRCASKKQDNAKGSKAFYLAISKRGFEDFVFDVEAEGLTLKEAQKLEFDIIEREGLRAGRGYNSAMGGCWRDISGDKNPMFGRNHSEEAKSKIALANKGKDNKTPEGKRRIAEAVRSHHIGMKRSPETKEKISKSKLGKKATPEARENMSKARAGVKFTEVRRKKHAPIAIKNGKKTSRPCSIFGVNYESVSEASRALKKSRHTIRKLMENKNGFIG